MGTSKFAALKSANLSIKEMKQITGGQWWAVYVDGQLVYWAKSDSKEAVIEQAKGYYGNNADIHVTEQD